MFGICNICLFEVSLVFTDGWWVTIEHDFYYSPDGLISAGRCDGSGLVPIPATLRRKD